jgi:putative two-component system response regulator
VCDVYDALRRRRSYKPALAHQTAVQMMTETFEGHFDPAMLQAFLRCQSEFDRIHSNSASAGTNHSNS